MLRSLSAAVLALAICACEPSLPQVTPTPTVTAVFDPTASKIPLPNDLVFAVPINAVCPAPANGDTTMTPMCAQAELIATLKGRFPSDQEVPLTIDFTENSYENGRLKQSAPNLDLSTIIPGVTLLVVGASGPMPLDPITPADYVIPTDASGVSDHGTLSLHHAGRTPWPTGGYALVMRGGDMGVKTADTPPIPVTPSPVFDLIEQGKDMTLPENLGLLKAQNGGSTTAALALGNQLNQLIAIYKNTAFPAADNVGKFPHEQLAIASTFQIDATVTNVTVDPARGLAPLPFDLLRDPTSHKLTPTAACALVNSKLDKTGACPNPAAAGFLTLDGFSTTGAILAPTSDLIDGATVTSNTARLYDLSDPKNPVLVTSDPPTGAVILEPCEFTAQFNGVSCDPTQPKLAPAIAFQPAGASNGDPSSVFRSRPLKDNNDYAVVLLSDPKPGGTGIKDKAGKPIGPGTVAKILQFKNPVSVGGHSALQGIDDTTALSLDTMRKQLIPVFTKLGSDASNVAMAYTFHTQSVLGTATDLGAFPYSLPSITAQPDKTSLTFGSATAAFTKYGVVPTIPSSNIDEILEVDITTFNLLDPATGAFRADPKLAAAEPIHVLIATPKPAAAPNCPAAPDPLSAFNKCAPMMVFRHGLTRGRADMLLIADTFAAAGMVTVAIDAAKHGDRTLCSSAVPAPASGCNGITPPDGLSHCTPLPGAVGQGDTAATGGPPGTCDATGLVKAPTTPVATGNTDGIAVASANYLISANFFRTRDSLRQDVIDQSQLVRAIAFIPTGPPPTTNAVFDHIVTHAATSTGGTTMIIDPSKIYFTGQSLGAIQGTVDVATNPRISKAGLNVGGGTIVDIFSNSPAFAAQFNALLKGLNITKGTPQYLQFLTVAKTILDPADPVNFAGHLTASTLPDLLTNPNRQVPQAAKKVLIQVANCDQVVPNPFGLVWSSTLAFANLASPVGPLPNNPAFFAPGSTGTFQLFAGPDFSAAGFGDPAQCGDLHTPGRNTAAGALLIGQPPNQTPSGGHGFLLSFEHPDLTAAAQSSLAGFMMAGTSPSSVVRAQ